MTATGGTLSGSLSLSSSGTFSAYIIQPTEAPANHPRGISLAVRYQPSYNNPYNYAYIINTKKDDFTSPLDISGNTGKGVRVIGSTGGSNINQFDTGSTAVMVADGSAASVQARANIMKNVALLTRNLTSGQSTNQVYYATNDVTYATVSNKIPDTLIIRGGNLTIDKDITTPIGIIVLKDDAGNGGDITVNGDVTRINANIYADGVLTGVRAPRSAEEGDLQLVLVGSLFSSNTIGKGDRDKDLNNVRNANSGNTAYKSYYDPFIIEQKLGNHAGFITQ